MTNQTTEDVVRTLCIGPTEYTTTTITGRERFWTRNTIDMCAPLERKEQQSNLEVAIVDSKRKQDPLFDSEQSLKNPTSDLHDYNIRSNIIHE